MDDSVVARNSQELDWECPGLILFKKSSLGTGLGISECCDSQSGWEQTSSMLQPFATSGVSEDMSMSQQGAVHRQHPWINRRAAMVATGLLAVMACNVRFDNVRAEDSKASADSAASTSAEPIVEGVSTGPEASVEPETAAEPAALAHRYARISKRNAFGIKPPVVPPPPEPEKEPPKDRPEFFLTGFTSIRGEKRAFVAYQPKGKPIQYPRALILDDEVNVADGVLKLMSINSVEKTVLIAFNDEEIPLNFKDNAVKVAGSGGAPGGAVPGAPGLPPSALRGNQPPPPIMNQPGNNAGAMNGGFFPGAVQGGQMPTVIGRGGAVLSGGQGFGTLQSTPFAANAIQAGGTAVHGGIEVPSISPSPDQLGGTVPANPSRPRNIQPPPFPGQ